MDNELRELRERIAEMGDAELLRMAGQDRSQYRAEAVEFASAELEARRAAAESQDDDDAADADEQQAPTLERQTCDLCGGRMRRGALFADREMTVYFDDTDEERFVEAMVCSACGNVRLVVDLDTEVQE